MNVFQRVTDWAKSRYISQQTPYDVGQDEKIETNCYNFYAGLRFMGVKGYVLNKAEELLEYVEAGAEDMKSNDTVDAIADSMIYDMTELLKMDLEPEKVISEVLKVVESRTGKWDEKLGKFVKDSSPEAKAKWYKPDYFKNCKIEENRTPSLLERHYHQGDNCKKCGKYFPNLLELAEHEDVCDET